MRRYTVKLAPLVLASLALAAPATAHADTAPGMAGDHTNSRSDSWKPVLCPETTGRYQARIEQGLRGLEDALGSSVTESFDDHERCASAHTRVRGLRASIRKTRVRLAAAPTITLRKRLARQQDQLGNAKDRVWEVC